MVKSGASGSTIFTLPAGYRPAKKLIFGARTDSGFGRVDVNADGTVVHVQGGTGYVSLEGMTFDVA